MGFFMDELERNKKALTSIYLEDIKVINHTCFIFMNDEKIVDISPSNTIDIDWIEKNDFNSEETKSITTLPDEIHYKSIYQNLAYIVFYTLFGEILSDNKLIMHNLKVNGYDDTKLYHCINRCIHPEPCKREFIWV